MSLPLFRIISTLGVAATQAATLSKCSPFHPPKPELLGPSILDVQADEVHNHSAVSLGPGSNEERSTESVLATSQLHTLILVGTTQSTLRSGYHSGVGICHSKPWVVEVKGALTLPHIRRRPRFRIYLHRWRSRHGSRSCSNRSHVVSEAKITSAGTYSKTMHPRPPMTWG